MPIIAWLERIATPLADAATRGAVILLAALLITTLLRRRSAAARHAVWAGAIAMQLVVLALAVWGPQWRVAAPHVVADAVATVPLLAIPDHAPSATAAADVSAVGDAIAPVAVPTPPVMKARTTGPTTADVARPARGRALLLYLWLAGALVVLVRLATGTAVVAMLARRGARVDDGGWLSLTQRLATSLGIDRPLILMRGTRIGVPVTWGIVYPVVLLPDEADGWSDEQRRFVLVHEMAHVKRLDALTQLVGQVVLALFWFNPLVWIANRRMQLEREHACDDYVLTHGTAPSAYAEELLAMVRRLGAPGQAAAQPAFAALAMARRSEFEGRMLSILDPVQDRHPLHRGRTVLSAAAALLVVVPLAALRPYREATPATAPVAAGIAPAGRMVISPPIAAPMAPLTSGGATTRDTSDLDASVASLAASVEATGKALDTRAAGLGIIAAAATEAQGRYDCGRARLDDDNNLTSIHNDDGDGGEPLVTYYALGAGRCAHVSLRGRVSFTEDESDVAALPEGASAFFRERTAADDRSLTVRRENGALARSYTRDGRTEPWDGEGQRWLARFLPGVLAEAGMNVGPRVARWRAQGGVDRVLREVGQLRSSGAKRSHYLALIDAGLSSRELDRAVQQAGRDISSSGDMRAVLLRAAPGLRTSGASAALMSAIAAVPSSGDRTAVLQAYGQTDNREVLLGVMRVAEGVPSSGDRARLLVSLAPRYLEGDATLRRAWLATAQTVPSSGDLSRVLRTAIGLVGREDDAALELLAVSRAVASSGDRTAVLTRLASANGLRTTRVRDAYLREAQALPSSGDMRRAMEAMPH